MCWYMHVFARPDLAFQTNVGAPSKSRVGMGEYNYN